MAAIRTIHCEDCGAPRKTRRANTKYCVVCRLLRNLKYLGSDRATCLVCEETFLPLQRGGSVCGKCDPIPVSGDPRGTCALCGTENASLVDSSVSVCRGCSTDPDQRPTFHAALIKKRQARIASKA